MSDKKCWFMFTRLFSACDWAVGGRGGLPGRPTINTFKKNAKPGVTSLHLSVVRPSIRLGLSVCLNFLVSLSVAVFVRPSSYTHVTLLRVCSPVYRPAQRPKMTPVFSLSLQVPQRMPRSGLEDQENIDREYRDEDA